MNTPDIAALAKLARSTAPMRRDPLDGLVPADTPPASPAESAKALLAECRKIYEAGRPIR